MSWTIHAEGCLTCRHHRSEQSVYVKHHWQLGQLQGKQLPVFSSVPLHRCLLKAPSYHVDSMHIRPVYNKTLPWRVQRVLCQDSGQSLQALLPCCAHSTPSPSPLDPCTGSSAASLQPQYC